MKPCGKRNIASIKFDSKVSRESQRTHLTTRRDCFTILFFIPIKTGAKTLYCKVDQL